MDSTGWCDSIRFSFIEIRFMIKAIFIKRIHTCAPFGSVSPTIWRSTLFWSGAKCVRRGGAKMLFMFGEFQKEVYSNYGSEGWVLLWFVLSTLLSWNVNSMGITVRSLVDIYSRWSNTWHHGSLCFMWNIWSLNSLQQKNVKLIKEQHMHRRRIKRDTDHVNDVTDVLASFVN